MSVKSNVCSMMAAILLMSCSGQTKLPENAIAIPVGNGRPVLVDGMFRPGEWDDALTVTLNDSMALLFKHYEGHAYLGVQVETRLAPMVDLFLTFDTVNVQWYHVSAQLAERSEQDSAALADTDGFTGGRTTDWYANEMRWDYSKRQALIGAGVSRDKAYLEAAYPADGIEFQFLRSKFTAPVGLMRIEIATPPDYGPSVVYPPGTERYNRDGWAPIVFK